MVLARVAAVARQEWNGVDPVLQIALVVSRMLPDLIGNRCRSWILRMAGVSVGPGTVVGGGIHIVGVGRLQDRFSIGARGWINAGCYFDASAPIRIGDDVAI